MTTQKERDYKPIFIVTIALALILIVIQNTTLAWIKTKEVKSDAYYKDQSYATCLNKSLSQSLTALTPEKVQMCVNAVEEMYNEKP